MRLARFLAIQALVLGTLAFITWILLVTLGTWPLRFSLDSLAAVSLAVLLTGSFLLFVSLPLQKLIGKNARLPLRLVIGAISGPLGVWLGLFALSSYPIDVRWYIIRAWQLHAVYAAVGISFSWAWHRRLRPNNSFKPRPLRGSA